MRRIVATILIALLVAPPASTGQTPGKPIEWQKTRSLEAGTEIVLTVAGGEPTKVRLLFADDANIITLKPTTALPGRVAKFLLKIGAEWPAVLSGSSTSTNASLWVSKDGIFDGDQKLCALADAVQQTARGDVKEIAKPRGHGGLIGWLGLGGILLVVAIGASLAAAGD